MRPVFVGNIGYGIRELELEQLFGIYGRVARVNIKSGYGFVYFGDERDAEDAIRKLDNYPFGCEKRRLSVQWGRGERSRHGDGKATSHQKPTKKLFVCNFDPSRTKEVDIEKHFEPYGKVISVRIRSNFSFVQFATQEGATKAFEATQRSQILGRAISIEYALNGDDDRRGGGGSPRRSLSPVFHRRPIPDYGRPRSPEYDRYSGPAACVRGRGSAAYERHRSPAAYDRRRSPAAYERRRSPAAYDRRMSPEAYDKRRSPTAYDRCRSPTVYDRRRNPTAYDRQRNPAAYDRSKSPTAYDRRRSSAAYDRQRSPAAYERRRSPTAYDRRMSPEYGRRSSDYGRQRSPPCDRYRSRSPVPRGRKAEEY